MVSIFTTLSLVMDINDFENCPKCSGAIYIASRKVSKQWACANPNCGYSSDFIKAEVAAKTIQWVKGKVVFDDKDRNIWMRGELDGETWLFRWVNGCFVSHKKMEVQGIAFTNGRLVEKIG